MGWRLFAVLLVALPLVMPALAKAQDDELMAACETEYMESFTEWQAYLATGRQGDAPERPDRSDPCFTVRLRGQIHAFEAERSAAPALQPTPVVEAPPPAATQLPSTAVPPVIAPPPAVTVIAPTATPTGSDPSNPSAMSPRLSALQGLINAQPDAILTCSALTRFGAASVVAVEVEGDWVAVVAFVQNGGSVADSSYTEFKLRDGRNRMFDMVSATGFPGYNTVLAGLRQIEALRSFDVVSQHTRIQPGRRAAVLMGFRVASDSEDLRLMASRTC